MTLQVLLDAVVSSEETGTGWIDCTGYIGSHLMIDLFSPMEGSTGSPIVSVELAEVPDIIAERYEYQPPKANAQEYFPRYLITRPWCRVLVGQSPQTWMRKVTIEEPTVNDDGRPTVNNPQLSYIGSIFKSIAYAGAHAGPVNTADGDPNQYRYRISNLRDGYPVDYNSSLKRVDVHPDGFRAHSGGNPPPKFLTQTPRAWNRGSGTIHAVVRHHDLEDGPNAIARWFRFDQKDDYRGFYDPSNGNWGMEFGNKVAKWLGFDNPWGQENNTFSLTVAWDVSTGWDMWLAGIKKSHAGYNISGVNVPTANGECEFLSNGSVNRLVAIAFMIATSKLSDSDIQALHENLYAWAG